MHAITSILETIGRAVGGVVGTLYQAGRDTIEQVLRNILPFMAFISMLIGIILFTGIGNLIAHTISPLASNIFAFSLSRSTVPFLSCPPFSDQELAFRRLSVTFSVLRFGW